MAKKYTPKNLAWEALRKRPGDLTTICRALAPPVQNRACTAFLVWMLRVWNRRSIRLDGHLSGEWRFASHRQLVEWGAATSVRTSEDILRSLGHWQAGRENAELIEKRKAHLGTDKNKLHLRPSLSLLRIMETMQLCRDNFPDNAAWSDFLKHISAPIEDVEIDGDTINVTPRLRRVARFLRHERTYGKYSLEQDLSYFVTLSRSWLKKPTANPVVQANPSTTKFVGNEDHATAKSVVTDLETGKPSETGDLETGNANQQIQPEKMTYVEEYKKKMEEKKAKKLEVYKFFGLEEP
tara:strand:+ start:168 stop:1052 length:885 start_codon:yes stop_codon:yes gene_type:complete